MTTSCSCGLAAQAAPPAALSAAANTAEFLVKRRRAPVFISFSRQLFIANPPKPPQPQGQYRQHKDAKKHISERAIAPRDQCHQTEASCKKDRSDEQSAGDAGACGHRKASA